MYRPRVDRERALQYGMPATTTFACSVCGRNVPAERSKWQPRFLELEVLGTDELDVSRWHL